MFGPTLVNKTTNWNIWTLYIADQMHEMVLSLLRKTWDDATLVLFVVRRPAMLSQTTSCHVEARSKTENV